MPRPVVQPLDPNSPAGRAAAIALGDVLDEIEEAIRIRESAAAQMAPISVIAPAPAVTRRRKAA